MALEIKSTKGEIWITGNASESQVNQVRNQLKTLLSIKDTVSINVSQLKKGQESFKKMIEVLKTEIKEYQTISYYGLNAPKLTQFDQTTTFPISIYLAA